MPTAPTMTHVAFLGSAALRYSADFTLSIVLGLRSDIGPPVRGHGSRLPRIRNTAPDFGPSPTAIVVRLSGPASHCSGDARSIHMIAGRTFGRCDVPGG